MKDKEDCFNETSNQCLLCPDALSIKYNTPLSNFEIPWQSFLMCDSASGFSYVPQLCGTVLKIQGKLVDPAVFSHDT